MKQDWPGHAAPDHAAPDPGRAWHALSADDVLAVLQTSSAGLASQAATERLEVYGANRLRPPPRRGPLVRLLLQFHNVLIYVLVVSAAITALMQHYVDASVIAGVVVINALIGFVQEGKAERALDAIRKMLSLQAAVLRDGHRQSIPAERLVPGDIVFIESGDRVPADLRLLEVKTLQVQEAALTGESAAVLKTVEPIAAVAALGDRTCMAYAGTLVAAGRGRGFVVATGDGTEVGRIGAMLSDVGTLATPLMEQLARFSWMLTLLILGLTVVVFGVGVFVYAFTTEDMFLAAVGLAVAAIPEGLPAIMTITLAIGVQRMAGRNAIIRRLPAVETLGSVSVICSDKTGTLTRNEMMVGSIAVGRHLIEVTGEGYVPRGQFLQDGAELDADQFALLRETIRGALLCSDANLRQEADEWVLEGDPTEGALVALAIKAGFDPAFESKAFPRTDVIPFESEHRFMATLHHDHQGRGYIYVKGAPERLLEMCHIEYGSDGEQLIDRRYWHQCIEALGGRGHRVLALAMKTTTANHRELSFDDVTTGLTLMGLFGLSDAPRTEAMRAVRRCQAAGIRVKMITGDHAGTARAIARAVGIANTDAVLTGVALDQLDDEALAAHAVEVDVYARTSPQHKLRLVEALQSRALIVAMTGDGVNDAPAVKRADIGIAMGRRGTEAAKEAAQMVLADDNFTSIAHAVEEGRIVYDNLQKAIQFILATNGAQALIIVVAVLLGRQLPITAVQILWVNMVTAVALSLALAFERAEADVMSRPPRSRSAPLLNGAMLWQVAFVSALILAGTFGIFDWQLRRGADLATARTSAVNTLVGFEIAYLFSARQWHRPAFGQHALAGIGPALIAAALTVLLQVAFTWWTPMQRLFHTRALDLTTCAAIGLASVAVLALAEIEKALSPARRRSLSPSP